MPPFKDQHNGSDEQLWSANVETTRKDIECIFGSLKKCFLILKHPIRLHKPTQIENMMTTCCVIHNLLLDYDKIDDWELELDDEDCNNDEFDMLEYEANVQASHSINNGNIAGGCHSRAVYRREYAPAAYSFCPEGMDFSVSSEEKARFAHRRKCLVEHLKVGLDGHYLLFHHR